MFAPTPAGTFTRLHEYRIVRLVLAKCWRAYYFLGGAFDAVHCSTAACCARQRRRRRHVADKNLRVSRRARAGFGQGLDSQEVRARSQEPSQQSSVWCRFELRVLESIGTDDILQIDEVLKAVYGPDVLLVD